MRLLIVSDHYLPGVGGAERQTRLLAQLFRARGAVVAIVVPWYGGAARVYEDAGVTVYRVRQLRTAVSWLVRDESERHAPPFPDPITVREIRRIITDFSPDVVHSHGWITYSCAAALGRNGVPLVVTARDYGFFCPNRTLLQDGAPCSGPGLTKCVGCAGRYYGVPKGWVAALGVFACRTLVRSRLTALHSISTFVSSTMRAHFLRRDGGAPHPAERPREFVIPSFREEPSEPENGSVLESHLGALPADPFILYVGQFRRAKGVGVLLAAYERLVDPPPLVLIGDYNWDGPVDFPPSVTVLTRLPYATVMAAWDRAMFGVMPSVWPEPFGSVVHEGMSRGRPVIGTDHGGHTDMIVDGVTGFLVPPGDVRALALAMDALISDPGRRERLGDAARERAKRFAAGVVFPEFVAAFEAVCAEQ